MKVERLAPIGILLLGSVLGVSAQNSFPDPYNDACWQNLAALRACEEAEYDRATDFAQRCTSYPEYQCEAGKERSVSAEERTKTKSKVIGDEVKAREQGTNTSRASAQHAGWN